ncbi:hypothetical protein [Ralstonia phage RP31]|uniref:Uncharacterized protein n=1 Tax=Ralstonia phage RP31 TaxID=1923890 RepID=A0A1L7N205_9CAUD|nr:hypothetical protein [Ralstonia phage RP31]
MSWQCKLIPIVGTKHVRFDPPKDNCIVGKTFLVHENGELLDHKELEPGSMFFVPENADMNEWPWYLATPDNISDLYKEVRPLFVVLPDQSLFLVHGKCWSNGQKYGGWTVTGEAPEITVHPSINLVGFYHGWIHNGIVSDDCEGRQFPPKLIDASA